MVTVYDNLAEAAIIPGNIPLTRQLRLGRIPTSYTPTQQLLRSSDSSHWHRLHSFAYFVQNADILATYTFGRSEIWKPRGRVLWGYGNGFSTVRKTTTK